MFKKYQNIQTLYKVFMKFIGNDILVGNSNYIKNLKFNILDKSYRNASTYCSKVTFRLMDLRF